MLISDFDFDLPKELIAQTPVEPRDHSRLMIVNRGKGTIEHDYFYNLLKHTSANNEFVFNDTKVIPARLYGFKPSGGKVEVLLIKSVASSGSWEWEVMIKNLESASEIDFSQGLKARVVSRGEDGVYVVEFNMQGEEFWKVIETNGYVPLPPYIKNNSDDMVKSEYLKHRYQTIYARSTGSVAAPTAGLHFTQDLMDKISNKSFVTLNVGLGTFQPLKNQVVSENKLHAEYYEIPKDTIEKIKTSTVTAVGTTTVRVLESWARNGQTRGETKIFIYPGYEFKVVKSLITNFHLPKSSLMMLVCAFGGKELIMKAYKEAVEKKYRFFSFGDAMLIV